MKTNLNFSTSDDSLLMTIVMLIQEISESVKKERPTETGYYDNADMKRIFHLSDSTLYRLRKENLIPYKKLGGKFYYPKSFLDHHFKT